MTSPPTIPIDAGHGATSKLLKFQYRSRMTSSGTGESSQYSMNVGYCVGCAKNRLSVALNRELTALSLRSDVGAHGVGQRAPPCLRETEDPEPLVQAQAPQKVVDILGS